MSQQSQWKASALAATFSSNAGLAGTAWGSARPPLHMSSEIGFGLGFGQPPSRSNMLLTSSFYYNAMTQMQMQMPSEGRIQKRKASSEDESMDSSSPTPEPANRKIRSLGDTRRLAHASASNARQPSSHTDGRKRTRVMDAAAPNEVSLDKLLEPLEEKDLRSLLETLISQHPQLATQVRQLVPKPTVNSACSQLVRLERRLQASFPYNKSGPASDDYTYHRVRPALEELRDTIVMYLDHFTHYGLIGVYAGTDTDTNTSTDTSSSSELAQAPSNALSHPAEWFDLLAQATDVAVRMPKWDKPENNEIRRDTLRQLADGWTRAVMATARWTEDGHIVGRDMLSQWAQQLDHFCSASGESALFQPAIQVFGQRFGRYYMRSAGRTSLETTA
ncbi:Tethering factor for nuclear proteasome sts1 [Coemansia erecta]|uniref:Tethering factor for nuclear proteasome STS1 n=1 Tax=Coemansia asiatica TaxID=1052880 RepID=A0A9W8CHI7_9FUNG|nr:Tethering factor for nuclear proteasome sts1 [Coemansia asiatica]KAJ2855894.1 Tethering factor for nuclear proteasome sts1 [Coemansia erecta]KAJ2888817.1 Tethering factor for nuclear proteasome sts1 [Coemansia asiatica]